MSGVSTAESRLSSRPGLPTEPGVPAPLRALPLRSRKLDILHLFVLSSFAISQPLYDYMLREPALVERNVHNLGGLLILTATVSLAFPLVLTLLEIAAGVLGTRVREAVHLGLLLTLGLLLALPTVNRLFPRGHAAGAALIALAGSGVATGLYLRFSRLQSAVTLAALGVFAFPLFFSCSPPIARTTQPQATHPTQARRSLPVVYIIFDEFCGQSLLTGNQEVDATRYPAFAELARTANWYRNATAVHAYTQQAIPALLTGKRCRDGQTSTLAEHPGNLLDLMARSTSHEPVIFEPLTRLAPDMQPRYFVQSGSWLLPAYHLAPTLAIVYLHYLCPPEDRYQLPEIPRDWFGVHSLEDVNRLQSSGVIRWPWMSHRNEQVDHFLRCIRKRDKPPFLFLHVVAPHFPLTYFPSGRSYLPDRGTLTPWEQVGAGFSEPNWRQDELAVVRSHQRYLLQCGYADYCLGRIVQQLKEAGLFDEALLVVTADHGAAHRSKLPRRNPLEDTLGELMSVPLFIKQPGQTTGLVSDRNVESIDILPTIAEAIGLDLPAEVEGVSILNTTVPERNEKLMVHGALYKVAAGFPQKQDALLRMLSRFGAETGWEPVFRKGVHPELLGKKLSDMQLGPACKVNLQVSLQNSHLPEGAAGQVPGFFAGKATPENPQDYPVTLALVVNGTIEAVTRTYDFRATPEEDRDGSRNWWEALVPETVFRTGDNDIEYFVVTGSPGQLLLRPIER